MAITIVGLGPGDPALLTREAWDVLACAQEVYLRTGRHPSVVGLPQTVVLHTFDALYEAADDFGQVYGAIVERVLELGRRPDGVVYAVPGHPLIGEATVTALLDRAAGEGIPVRIVAGLSFIEPVLTALQVDGMTGLQVADALELAGRLHPALNPDAPALLGQLYSRELSGDVKLTLMNQYPDEHPVHLVHAAGTADEKVESIPLHALDHSPHISHLTALFLPPLPYSGGFESFQETIARLRGPGGCPWDQQQTHQSLGQGLLEETAEVLDALDTDDMDALCEELGDLLLHIVMQAQIATEDGDFTAADVIAGIEAKIRRRHPHVFGKTKVSGVGEVLANWDAIKREEKGKENSTLAAVPKAMPALARADAMARKAAGAGLGWPSMDDVVDEVREEMAELLAAGTPEAQAVGLGDLLFAVVNWARWLKLDAEGALRQANRRFQSRFEKFQRAAAGVENLDRATIKLLWERAKLNAEEG